MAENQTSEFLELIFEGKADDEHVLTWHSASGVPTYPIPVDELKKRINNNKLGAAHFSLSTVKLNAEGKLRRKKDNFIKFYLVMIDDIGTSAGSKISADKLPKKLLDLVTYKIETSANNEQWGFLLNKPIDNYVTAQILLSEIVDKSGSDRGGCSATRLARLPAGMNLKKVNDDSNGKHFKCKLLFFNPKLRSTPDELLHAVESNLRWEEIKKLKNVKQLRGGTTCYKSVYLANIDGIVDPVLEFLNTSKLILSEGDEWQMIKCPWGDGHSDGNSVAYYSAVGHGAHIHSRGFNCFHTHCQNKGTGDFLQWIADSGGPHASVHDPVCDLVAQYAIDICTNEIVNMKSKTLSRIMVSGFKNGFQRTVFVNKGEGKIFKTNEYDLFIRDPGLLRVAGSRRAPGQQSILTADDGESKQINSWIARAWGCGEFDQKIVDVFIDYIAYLMPAGQDAEWFLDHIAMKAKNATYRGAGVIMTTPVQGTGRGTLTTILSRLWGATNVTTVSLSNLVAGAVSDDNNSWITSDWIVVPEAREAAVHARTAARAYESLKSFIEPGASNVLIKEKWQVGKNEQCYGSVIICSQHNDALTTEAQDTRFKRVQNTVVARDADYFEKIWAWIDSGFEKHVWRWLLARDVGDFKAFARQTIGSLHERIQHTVDTGSGIDIAIAIALGFCELELSGCVFMKPLLNAIDGIATELGVDEIGNWKKIVEREIKNQTRSVSVGGSSAQTAAERQTLRPRFFGARYRMRRTISKEGEMLADINNKFGVLQTIVDTVEKKLTTSGLQKFWRNFQE